MIAAYRPSPTLLAGREETMSVKTLRIHAPWLALFAVLLGTLAAPAQEVSIGIVPSLMKDLSAGQQKFIRGEFPILVKEFTGLDGKLVEDSSVEEVARKTIDGTHQFAVFQGVEFAWVTEKNTELKPLLTAIYRTPRNQAVLVAKKGNPVKSVADLKGKPFGWVKAGKEHVVLFTEKIAGGDPAKFFGKMSAPTNPEAALDDVLLGKVDGAVVDQASLEVYKEVNPGRYNRLQIVSKSPEFPPSVVAYAQGKVNDQVLTQFKNGMLKANESPRGRDFMSSFRITAFQPVPAEYDTWLADIRKEFPAPGAAR
jgi:ABC-type phosphate/phosphonate transport system substrate-binding protein